MLPNAAFGAASGPAFHPASPSTSAPTLRQSVEDWAAYAKTHRPNLGDHLARIFLRDAAAGQRIASFRQARSEFLDRLAQSLPPGTDRPVRDRGGRLPGVRDLLERSIPASRPLTASQVLARVADVMHRDAGPAIDTVLTVVARLPADQGPGAAARAAVADPALRPGLVALFKSRLAEPFMASQGESRQAAIDLLTPYAQAVAAASGQAQQADPKVVASNAANPEERLKALAFQASRALLPSGELPGLLGKLLGSEASPRQVQQAVARSMAKFVAQAPGKMSADEFIVRDQLADALARERQKAIRDALAGFKDPGNGGQVKRWKHAEGVIGELAASFQKAIDQTAYQDLKPTLAWTPGYWAKTLEAAAKPL